MTDPIIKIFFADEKCHNSRISFMTQRYDHYMYCDTIFQVNIDLFAHQPISPMPHLILSPPSPIHLLAQFPAPSQLRNSLPSAVAHNSTNQAQSHFHKMLQSLKKQTSCHLLRVSRFQPSYLPKPLSHQPNHSTKLLTTPSKPFSTSPTPYYSTPIQPLFNKHSPKPPSIKQTVLKSHRRRFTTTPTPEPSPPALPPPQIAPESTLLPNLPKAFPKFKSLTEFTLWYKVDPPSYHRFSKAWWLSFSWLMLMYSATGYTALTVVREVFKLMGIDNVSLFHGETHHRVLYFLLMTPTYSFLTLIFGRIFGRPQYADRMFRRIWSRFFPFLFKK